MSYKVVIAIDFGTSRSGFAYAFCDEPDKIDSKSDWVSSHSYRKTATCLLYDADDKLVAWGDVAKKRLAEERKISKKENNNNSRYFYLIEGFKMQILSPDGKYRENFKVLEQPKGKNTYEVDGEVFKTPKSKKEINIFNLVVDYLSSIKESALNRMRSKTVTTVLDKEIRWVLTIPAIWRDEDKQFMREASVKAQLISQDEDDYNRLLFAFEPESAAFFCNRQKALVENNSVFMILDCGGGTVDITTYRLLNNKFQSIQGVFNTGGAYGSTFVNDEVFNSLAQKISSEAMVRFHDEYPLELYETNWQLERLKCDITNDNQNKCMTFDVPRALEEILQKEFTDKFNELLEEGETYLQQIEIPCSKKSLFEPTLNGLVNEANKAFNLLSKIGVKCDYILLVGGYSNSIFLQQRIKDEYEILGKVKKVIHPVDPEIAVMYGAVYFGLNPNIWIDRVASRTYGKSVAKEFCIGDPESKKIIEDGVKYCKDHFDIFVRKGDIVTAGKKVTRQYIPLTKDQKSRRVMLYSSTSDNPVFVDEPNVISHQSQDITRDDTRSGKDWTIEVSMYFGETEIKVEITDFDTGLTKVLKLDFRYKYQ